MHHERELTTVMVSHEPEWVEQYADKVYLLKEVWPTSRHELARRPPSPLLCSTRSLRSSSLVLPFL